MGDRPPISGDFVRRDHVDLRDRHYEPSLRILPPFLKPGEGFDWLYGSERGRTSDGKPIFGVRHQGPYGRCAGHALAAVIDLQRQAFADQRRPAHEIVSADMLYWTARYHEQFQENGTAPIKPSGEGVRSLRSVLKGFYHHGVCLDHPDWRVGEARAECWKSASNGTGPACIGGKLQRFPTVAQAKDARKINLGAYYRLRPILNDYHAALHETGAVLVSASIHEGWEKLKDGRITPGKGTTGAHAFAIVGYNTEGFLVLNSWGDEWGGYDGKRGVALWPYGDWAQCILDGWVLRLGVSAPESFDITIGQQGIQGVLGPIQSSSSTPCIQLLGHFMHLDDGFHVNHGAYPSFEESWDQTKRLLTGRLKADAKPHGGPRSDYRGIVVWLPGSFEGIKPSFAAAARRKAAMMDMGLYPYTVFWCNDFVEKSMEVLASVFATCKKQTGDDANALATLIETSYRGVGRAFWRDIELGARRAVDGIYETPDTGDVTRPKKQPGLLVEFFEDIFQLTAKNGAELHLVAEGAGALVLHEMLAYFTASGEHTLDSLAARFTTVQLALPAIEVPRACRRIMPLAAAMNHDKRRARIYVPSAELEGRVHFGDYNRSVLHLISRAFEDRLCRPDTVHPDPITEPRHPNHPLQPPRPFLGMASAAGEVAKLEPQLAEAARAAFVAVSELADPARPHDLEAITPRHAQRGPVDQAQLSNDPGIELRMLQMIRRSLEEKGSS